MSRTFLREIPLDKFDDKQLKYYEAQGYEIVWLTDSVEIWAK